MFVRAAALPVDEAQTRQLQAMARAGITPQKMAEATQQAEFTAHPERVRMGQLFDLLLEFYRKHERRSTYDVERKIESRLRKYFGRIKANAVTSTVIDRYISSRRAEKPKP